MKTSTKQARHSETLPVIHFLGVFLILAALLPGVQASPAGAGYGQDFLIDSDPSGTIRNATVPVQNITPTEPAPGTGIPGQGADIGNNTIIIPPEGQPTPLVTPTIPQGNVSVNTTVTIPVQTPTTPNDSPGTGNTSAGNPGASVTVTPTITVNATVPVTPSPGSSLAQDKTPEDLQGLLTLLHAKLQALFATPGADTAEVREEVREILNETIEEIEEEQEELAEESGHPSNKTRSIASARPTASLTISPAVSNGSHASDADQAVVGNAGTGTHHHENDDEDEEDDD